MVSKGISPSCICCTHTLSQETDLDKLGCGLSEIPKKHSQTRKENVQLHGCFLVLSKLFFEYFDGLYSGTFLYMEEDILFWQLMQKNLTSVYLPDIHVFHKEDSASKVVWSSDRKRTLVKQKICLDSAKAFEKLMKEDARNRADVNV